MTLPQIGIQATIFIRAIISIILLTLSTLLIHGSKPTEFQLGGVLFAYPYVDSVPYVTTPPPPGYIPFHIEHYGRHGSRLMLSAEDYEVPVKNLEKAEKAGKLTQLGKETLNYLRQLRHASKGRLGELTEKGKRQHYAIGQRIARNYPEIFNSEARLSATSTPVARCIASMNSALDGIRNISPEAIFSKDSSEANLWFMNFKDVEALQIRDNINSQILNHYRDSIMAEATFLSNLVSDRNFARKHVEPGLLPRLYWALSSPQNINDSSLWLRKVFGPDDLMRNWNYGNARRFLLGGNSRLTQNRMPYSQKNLLSQIISMADLAISQGITGANLRFGHDDVLMPLIVLMELGNFGQEINSFEQLEESGWHDYDITPMAGNLQLVFYRNENGDDILVKALINEMEVTMPGSPVSGPYYRWEDVKDYYLSKLSKFPPKIHTSY